MVMDENGRNGGNWYLAQQIVQPVIRYVLSSVTFQQQITQPVIMRILSTTTTSTTCNHTKTTNHRTRNQTT